MTIFIISERHMKMYVLGKKLTADGAFNFSLLTKRIAFTNYVVWKIWKSWKG